MTIPDIEEIHRVRLPDDALKLPGVSMNLAFAVFYSRFQSPVELNEAPEIATKRRLEFRIGVAFGKLLWCRSSCEIEPRLRLSHRLPLRLRQAREQMERKSENKKTKRICEQLIENPRRIFMAQCLIIAEAPVGNVIGRRTYVSIVSYSYTKCDNLCRDFGRES